MSYANAWSDVIRANWANVQLLIDMRTGSYQDLSDNARVVTLTPWAGTRPPQWLTQTAGKGMEMGGVAGGGGVLTVPNTASLNLNPSGTIMCFCRFEFPLWAGCRFVWKRTGVVTSYDLFDSTGAGVLGIYDGTTSHALGSYSVPTARSIGSSFTAGSPPRGYANGVQTVPAPITMWAPGSDNGVLSLPGSAGLVAPSVTWWCWLLFSAYLTGSDIAKLHADWMASGHYL